MLKKYREILSYMFFGIFTTLTSIVTFALFDRILGSDLYLLSNVISWCFAVVVAFVTNKLWVFGSKSWAAKTLAKELSGFLGARILSLFLEEFGLWLMIDILLMDKLSFDLKILTLSGTMLAKIIMQVIVVLANYIFSKFFIFKQPQART